MKHFCTVLLINLLIILSTNALADTAVGPMNYQGRLLDNAGVPLTGSYNFVVRVYDAVSGGVLKYQEAHSAVSVDDGVYSFMVGTTTKTGGDSTWSVELWNCCANLYMEVEVNSQILTPRHQLAATPYAYQANLALTTNNALALGGKTASEYDNILADICVSSKGKWLELANSGKGECLGIGASIPGPTMVSWNTLTANSNFTSLDLTKANISGINFSGADLTGTILKKTTFSVQGMSGANLTDTEWNSANASDVSAYTLSASTNLQGATFQNMDLSKWNLSSVTISNMSKLSAATISACTAGLPANWLCKSDGLGGSNFFLLGIGVNLSAGSAASSFKFGSSYLNLGKEALANSNLNGATFVGNVINQNFTNVDLTNVDFSYATITNSVFSGTSTRIISSKFINARIDRPVISSGVVFDAADFTEADLNYVKFQQDILTGANFSGATLRGVGFAGIQNGNFTGAVLDGVYIDGNHGNNNFSQSRFYNGFRQGPTASATTSYLGGSTYFKTTFVGGVLSGDFHGATFTSTVTFDNVLWQHLDLCGTSMLAIFTDQTYSTPYGYDDLKTVSTPAPGTGLAQVECPSGQDVTGGASHCGAGSAFMTPIAVQANCTPGVP